MKNTYTGNTFFFFAYPVVMEEKQIRNELKRWNWREWLNPLPLPPF
jgi:hypothetical protein